MIRETAQQQQIGINNNNTKQLNEFDRACSCQPKEHFSHHCHTWSFLLCTGLLAESKWHFKYSDIPKGKFACVFAAEQVGKVCTRASVSPSRQHHLSAQVGRGWIGMASIQRLSDCLLISWSPGHLPASPLSETAITTHTFPIADVENKSALMVLHT